MWMHYFKIAFRNLWKYRMHNLISILGLSMGFACFALALSWIRYEFTYDSFHEGADRIYQVHVKTTSEKRGIGFTVPYLTGSYLQELYPEIEQTCTASMYSAKYKYEGVSFSTYQVACNSSFFTFWDIKIIAGTDKFLHGNGEEIAITKELASRLFPGEEPIGKELEDSYSGQKRRICAVVAGWPSPTNFPFEIILPLTNQTDEWWAYMWHCFVRVKKGADAKSFVEKVESTPKETSGMFIEWVLIPLQSIRYILPEKEPAVKLTHIQLFALTGGLVVLCALLNYWGLFFSHLQIRLREMGLRVVCGASWIKLLKMLLIENLILLCIATLAGMLWIELYIQPFKELATIHISDYAVYAEALFYMCIVIISTLFFVGTAIYYFHRRKWRTSPYQSSLYGQNVIRKGCLFVQLIISIGFIYCTIVIVNQLHFLFYQDLGFARENRGVIHTVQKEGQERLATYLQQLPMISEVHANYASLLPETNTKMYASFNEWEGKSYSPDIQDALLLYGSREYMKFYELTLLEGTIPEMDQTQKKIVINETFAKALNVPDPVGLHVQYKNQGILYTEYEICGIVKDFHYLPPTLPVRPVILIFPERQGVQFNGVTFSAGTSDILFKYQAQSWMDCKARIEQFIESEMPSLYYEQIVNMDEAYELFLESERILLYLLSIVSGVCIGVCLFGVYSLALLSCERRRKEIAIRKVHGASLSHIVHLFFKEYMLLLGMAALIAFPLSYLAMNKWLDQFTNRAEIGLWIYLLILIVLTILIVFTVGYLVRKAARQNPVQVFK